MYRGIFALAILLAPVSVHPAAEPKTPTATAEATAAAAPQAVTLETILQKRSDGRTPTRHVLVARINRDGVKETSCVVTVEAARDFMRRVPEAAVVPQQEK